MKIKKKKFKNGMCIQWDDDDPAERAKALIAKINADLNHAWGDSLPADILEKIKSIVVTK